MSNKAYKQELLNRLLKFSVRIINLASKLPKTPAGFAIANQIIRSACSVGANCAEAQHSISSKEFTHSLKYRSKRSEGDLLLVRGY